MNDGTDDAIIIVGAAEEKRGCVVREKAERTSLRLHPAVHSLMRAGARNLASFRFPLLFLQLLLNRSATCRFVFLSPHRSKTARQTGSWITCRLRVMTNGSMLRPPVRAAQPFIRVTSMALFEPSGVQQSLAGLYSDNWSVSWEPAPGRVGKSYLAKSPGWIARSASSVRVDSRQITLPLDRKRLIYSKEVRLTWCMPDGDCN